MKDFMKRYKKSFTLCCLAAFIVALLAALKPPTREAFSSQGKNHMSYQPGSQAAEQPLSTPPSYQYPIEQFKAEEFDVETRIDFPVPVSIDSEQYTEYITHDNGVLELSLIDQGDTITYLFQVSSIVEHQCESDDTRACQAATAKGNIAEIQITLPQGQLVIGAYPLTEDISTQGNEAIVYSRQLYSDSSHGQLGCQMWSSGTLNVTSAVYDVNGKLEYLDANVIRECHQTTPLPSLPPQDALLQTEVKNIESYTYYASWRCHFTLLPEVL